MRRHHVGAPRRPGTWDALVRRIAVAHGLQLRQARALLADALQVLEHQVHQHGRVSVPGFGVFRVRQRLARTVQLPGGEVREVSPAHVVTFRPAKQWRIR